ncbi:M15 family metallopeptidase [Aquimarina sp. W85]|uniref:M15 family metallopeptidase n=1 Tax=Aquimarina rhodophyticola TaxID=3342246 RepID=UPI00366B605D
MRRVLLLLILPVTVGFSQKKFDKADLMGKSEISFYGDTYLLRKEAHEAFLKMRESAAKEGIELKVISSYRSFEHQNSIWTRKYKRFTSSGMSPLDAIKKIIEYSTIPGTSRHHWGTDLDIVDGKPVQPKDVLLTKHFEEMGPYCKFKEWMDQNAESFGYFLVYNNDPKREGFKYEPWHYSYGAISKPMLMDYQGLDLVEELTKNEIIGHEYITKEFIETYFDKNLLDINPKLKN